MEEFFPQLGREGVLKSKSPPRLWCLPHFPSVDLHLLGISSTGDSAPPPPPRTLELDWHWNWRLLEDGE